jgi:hypothetical protein
MQHGHVAAGVVVLSPEFIRKPYCMEELVVLHRRWQLDEAGLVVALYGQTMEELRGMRSQYRQPEFWCLNGKAYPRPSEEALDRWAAALEGLGQCTLIRPDQVCK